LNKSGKNKTRKTGHTKNKKKRARFHLGKTTWDQDIDTTEKHFNIECIVPKLRNKDLIGWLGKRALLKFTRSKHVQYEEGKYLIYEYEYKENLSKTVKKIA